jgi:phosphate:Na+ symporter
MPSLILLHIIGAVCLLLFGLRLVRNGVTRAFGVELRKFISFSTKNRILGFLSGIGVTTFLQSSTATTMIVTSFAGQGLITTVAGLAVVLGADVGTTIVAQILTFDLSWLSPVLIILGYFSYTIKDQSTPLRQAGRILLGLGLMLLALSLIKQSAVPLKQSEILPMILAPLNDDPIFAVLLGALLTWLFHSSLAIVLLLMSMESAELISVHLGLMMVLGANIGNVIAPLLSSLRDPPEATRIPLGNLLMRTVGVAVFLIFIHDVESVLNEIFADKARALVMFHMFFNVAVALAFLPFLDVVHRVSCLIVKPRDEKTDITKPQYLDDRVLDMPTVALTNAARESLRMADFLDQMFQDAWNALRQGSTQLVARAEATDIVIDKLYKSIKAYLVRLGSETLNTTEAKRHFQILTFATNIEHVGDIIDKNLIPLAEKKIREGKQFSVEGEKELNELFGLVLDSVRLAQTVFISGDSRLARQLVEDKAVIKKAEVQASINHMARLQAGVKETQDTSDLHMDIVRDLRRINSLMASIAYPILEEAGALRPSLLREQQTQAE